MKIHPIYPANQFVACLFFEYVGAVRDGILDELDQTSPEIKISRSGAMELVLSNLLAGMSPAGNA